MMQRRSRPPQGPATSTPPNAAAELTADRDRGEWLRAVGGLTEFQRAGYDEPAVYADLHGGGCAW